MPHPRKLLAVAAATFLLVLSAGGSALAAGASSTEITITGINGVETFTTTGGTLCASGWSEDSFEKFGGADRSHAGTFHGYKTLHCGDDSGTFNITYDAATVWGTPGDQGGWKLYNGTGAYTGCSGGGNLVGLYIPDGIVDQYTGRVQCGN